MKPIPHYLSQTELIVGIDFARGWVLVGELARRDDPTSVCRHYRWRLGGWWVCDRPGRSEQPRPPIDAEAHAWRNDPKRDCEAGSLRVTYERAFLTVGRSDLRRALESILKLSGNSLDVDGLVTVHVHPHGLVLRSHGNQSMRVDVPLDAEVARDGLGTAVVLGAALREAIKVVSADIVSIVVESSGDAPSVIVRGCVGTVHERRVWTVHVRPMPTPLSHAAAPVDLGLTQAIARALSFASMEEYRPNISCVLLDGREDHVRVVATDGHRLYQEDVSAPLAVEALAQRKVVVPRSVLVSLRPGKRSGNYRFAFSDDEVTVTSDDRVVVCPPASAVFPPYTQLNLPRLHALDVPRGWALIEVPADVAAKMRAWVHEQAETDLRDDAGNACPVTLRIDFAGNLLLHVKPDEPCVPGCGRFVVPFPAEENDADEDARSTDWRLQPAYLDEALAVVSEDESLHVAVCKQLDPIYLFDSTRIVCTMPQRW